MGGLISVVDKTVLEDAAGGTIANQLKSSIPVD